ncbi:hypothetical protein FNV43_RR04564 [Rhamnella rubrinervis]|uniref:Uncharacterized protein n=1 Tax=Rhamnella rubrinervis TaxID=2594499 RepID=A0A8K0MPW5_9ROSA|nr:hypothetical protein FNV43_RR04564 [Rhamnella rubrinervis]
MHTHIGQLASAFLCVSCNQSHVLVEAHISKRSRLSSKPTSFQSDIVIELYRAEVDDLGELEALTKHLAYLGFEVSCVAEASLDDEDPDEFDDPEED